MKEILKHTAENTDLYANLKQVLSKMEPIVDHLFEKKEIADNLHILVIIQETMEGFDQQVEYFMEYKDKYIESISCPPNKEICKRW